jgi:threonylcarbamoyladenosine tRNA methylthiotransferase MtaB
MPGQLPNSVKKERSKLLMKLGEELAEDFHRRYLGRVLSVLVEERQGGYVTGYSPNYIRVRAKADRDINTLVPVRITHVTSAGAAGELAE